MIAFAIGLWFLLWVTAGPGEESALKSGYPSIGTIEDMRGAFLAAIGENPSDAQALVAGLAIGERSLLSEQTAAQMRDLSLTHLVAVSGANLAIVVGAVWFLLAAIGLSRNLRFFLGLVAMGFYVLLVGPESSVIRAATMALFVTVALWLGRGSSALNALALAVVVILVIDRAMATDFGFSLSAIATAGLLVAASPIFEILREKIPDWLALGIAAAVAAQIYTTPILLMLQPGLPVYAVLANLLVEPVIAPVTILGILAAGVAAFLPWASDLLVGVASLGTSWIVAVAQQLSSWPMVRVHFVAPPLGVVIAATVVIAITAYFRSEDQGSKRRALALITAAISAGIVLSLWDVHRHGRAFDNWVVLNCDVGQGDALLVRSGKQIALIDVGPQEADVMRCLEFAGVSKIDLLIISHYDADHVAGIAGLDDVELGLTLLPGFEDDRPLADKVQAVTRRRSAAVAIAQRGMQGELGSCNWRILEPSYSAKEATDSNDASVVVLFDCPDFRVLALGDLGESGQHRLLTSSREYLKSDTPLVLKVAHHGSADQSRELHESLRPEVALVSVGRNRFGHPTDRILRILNSIGSSVYRTDLSGAVSIGLSAEGLAVRSAGKLAK